MLQIPVTMRSPNPETPPFETIGYVPDASSPLAVTHDAAFDEAAGTWTPNAEWRITHLVTGFSLGPKRWPTRADAMAVLERCDLAFPAWSRATGKPGCVATAACAYKFRMALKC